MFRILTDELARVRALNESKGHFVIVKTGAVANIDSVLKDVTTKFSGKIRSKKKDGATMVTILSFGTDTAALKAAKYIEDEDHELIRSVDVRDELV